MRNLLVTFFMLVTSLSAFAHPTEETKVVNLPDNVSFTMKSDLNILPNTTYSMIGDNCWLGFAPSTRDRVLKAGRKFDTVRVELTRNDGYIIWIINQSPALELWCAKSLTFGKFKSDASQVLEVTLPAPEEF